MTQGSCQCGRIRFHITGPLEAASLCHCVQCRKQSSHAFAGANAKKAAVKLEGAEHLSWYQASEKVRRGFCKHCGSWLFWEPIHRDWTSVALGSIDGPSGVRLEQHIFVSEKGDYYDIADGVPQNAR
jgi:hypothetical protein